MAIRSAPRFAGVVLLSGLVAGALDIIAAIFQNASDLSPQQVLQAVSAGGLGGAAFEGSWPTAALGLALHFGLMLGWAGLFALLMLVGPEFRRRWLIAGTVWGVVVWAAMSLIVVPLSAAPFSVADAPDEILIGLLVHILAVGLPMAAIVRWRLGDGRPVTAG